MHSSITIIDSHTAGEPTRVVVDGGPELDAGLGDGPLDQRAVRLREKFDNIRTGVICEPRGHDVLVGALLCTPHDLSCDAGAIFFNNVGYLGMCGHGMIGVVETLRHMGRIQSNQCRIDTPVGVVTADLKDDGSIAIDNVPSYRVAKDVEIEVESVGRVVGDVAWGGNWFYLVKDPQPELSLTRVAELTKMTVAIRSAINAQGFPKVDHVELFSDANTDSEIDSMNFVLCPGLEYDRSPCGTGTSAKLACLAADGKLQPDQIWRQAGILGTCFQGSFQWAPKGPVNEEEQQTILPTIAGKAFITGETKLLFAESDPFRFGIR